MRATRLGALAICFFSPASGNATYPWSWGPLLTDDILVRDVYDPKVGSGIFAIFARVSGTTRENEIREYAILYMGSGQTLPAAGTRCRIDYRHGRLAEWVDEDLSPILGRMVEHFDCNDGRHWPDGSPSRPRR